MTLSDVVEINPRLNGAAALPGDTPTSFVPMASVSEVTGSIAREETRPLKDVMKGFTYFRNGDVLVAKITPCFQNGKIALARISHAHGFGSTEFHVFRANTDVLDPRFLYHFMRQEKLREAGVRRMTGTGGQQRVPTAFFEQMKFPLPSLFEQRRIAEVLDKADALRAKRRQAIAKLDTLLSAIFIEMFGDPRLNERKWPTPEMRELFASPPIFGSMIPPGATGKWLSLRVGNIQNWQLDLRDSKHIDLLPESVARHSVREGDILLARAIACQEHLGKCIVAYPGGGAWAFDSHLMRVRLRREVIQPEFVRHTFMSDGGRALFLAKTRKSTVQYNINTKELASLRIPVPPIELQNRFFSVVRKVDELKNQGSAAHALLDSMFAAIQASAFPPAPK